MMRTEIDGLKVVITEHDNNAVDFEIYMNGELFTQKKQLSVVKAAQEIGAAMFDEVNFRRNNPD